jgi:histidinol-phosphate aminotransferase
MLKARKAVLDLRGYHPPLAGRTGLRLDFNENTKGCSLRVLERIRQISPEELARYPEREPVEKRIATKLGLNPDQALLTNGVDEAIHLLCETYLDPADEVIIVTPTFGMYEVLAAATGARVIRVECQGEFRFPLTETLVAVNGRTRFIVIASPNNPTGTVASRTDILQLCNVAPHAAVLVDEAYYEFYGETVLPDVSSTANLFVARTFSKAYGLAGLRAGILAGDATQMALVRRVASPYNVNAVALLALPAAIADTEYVARYVEQVKRGRERLASTLKSLGIRYWPSHANFLLAYMGERHRDFVGGMRQRGILVRDRSTDPGCDGCVRITIGTSEQMDQVLPALEQVLQEIGLTKAAKV